jgi:hypothetical protein
MYDAIVVGARCGLPLAMLHEGFTGQRPIAEALGDYQRERDEQTRPACQFTTMISDLQFGPELQALFGAVSGDEAATREFLGMVGGGVTGEEFFAPVNVGAILPKVAA